MVAFAGAARPADPHPPTIIICAPLPPQPPLLRDCYRSSGRRELIKWRPKELVNDSYEGRLIEPHDLTLADSLRYCAPGLCPSPFDSPPKKSLFLAEYKEGVQTQ
jgi:hypothetical protein